jgi:hypothetical protein
MSSRPLTDDDLEFRSSAIFALLAALGYIPDDGSPESWRPAQARMNQAIDARRMEKPGEGRYKIVRAFLQDQQHRWALGGVDVDTSA